MTKDNILWYYIHQMEPKWSDLLKQINALLTPAKEVVVIVKPNPALDALASALGLTQALRKIGRRASLVCPAKITGFKELKGIEEILTDFPKKQLAITVNYQQGSFDQGETQKTNKGLQINLLPQSGQSVIEPLNINYKEYQSQPDAAILIEIENLAHLQEFYQKNQSFFSQASLINIDYHPNNARYGKVNLIDPKASSISEMVTLMLYDLRVAMDEIIADNLYQGLANKTQNFAPNYHSANLLEAASICLRYKGTAQRPAVETQPRAQASNNPPNIPDSQSSSWPQTTTAWPKT